MNTLSQVPVHPSIRNLSSVVGSAGVHPSWYIHACGLVVCRTTMHSHPYGQFRITNQPDMRVFGRWEEAGVRRETPRKQFHVFPKGHDCMTSKKASVFFKSTPGTTGV